MKTKEKLIEELMTKGRGLLVWKIQTICTNCFSSTSIVSYLLLSGLL